jgi:hypothetical protein
MIERRFIAAWFFVFSFNTQAQVTADSTSQSTAAAQSITIQTNIEGATVFIDGDSVGLTPLTFHTTPGAHHVRILSDVANWLSEPISDSIAVAPNEQRTLRYAFAQKFLILSNPSGAEVLARDSVIGTTPLVVKQSGDADFRVRRAGYEETPLDFTSASRGILSTTLNKKWQSENDDTIFKEAEVKNSSLKLYFAGAATIVAGAASAYFKVKADNNYSEYIRTGDPARLSDVNRLDTSAGIALAATQISLGLFTYFLLSE